MTQYHIIIHGRVQGVGFRYYTQKKATLFGLTGWVRNLRGGEVEILVGAEDLAIEEFLLELEKGPAKAKVDRIVINLVVNQNIMKEFNVREDGDKPCEF